MWDEAVLSRHFSKDGHFYHVHFLLIASIIVINVCYYTWDDILFADVMLWLSKYLFASILLQYKRRNQSSEKYCEIYWTLHDDKILIFGFEMKRWGFFFLAFVNFTNVLPLYPFLTNFEILFRFPLMTTMELRLGGYNLLSGIQYFHWRNSFTEW